MSFRTPWSVRAVSSEQAKPLSHIEESAGGPTAVRDDTLDYLGPKGRKQVEKIALKKATRKPKNFFDSFSSEPSALLSLKFFLSREEFLDSFFLCALCVLCG